MYTGSGRALCGWITHGKASVVQSRFYAWAEIIFFLCWISTTFCVGYREKKIEFCIFLWFFLGTRWSSPSSCGSRLPALGVWLGRPWRLRKASLKYASLDWVLPAVSLWYQTCQVQELTVKTHKLGVHCKRDLPAFFIICSFVSGSKLICCGFFVVVLFFGLVFFSLVCCCSLGGFFFSMAWGDPSWFTNL